MLNASQTCEHCYSRAGDGLEPLTQCRRPKHRPHLKVEPHSTHCLAGTGATQIYNDCFTYFHRQRRVSRHFYTMYLSILTMLKRQRTLLYLIKALHDSNKPATRTFLDKLLFLLRKEYAMGDLVKFYNFYPHKYGPFSNEFYRDLADAQSHGYLKEVSQKFNLTPSGLEIADSVTDKERKLIDQLTAIFDRNTIVEYAYSKYPEYTARSLLKNHEERKTQPGIFSIGYEGKDIDLFLDLLIQNGINVLVDIRANPFSMNFAFTKNKLVQSLESAQIEYLHLPELGISGEHRQSLETAEDYAKLFEFYSASILPAQMHKVKELAELGKNKRIALMCFEADKTKCHRGIVSEKIEQLNKTVTHL